MSVLSLSSWPSLRRLLLATVVVYPAAADAQVTRQAAPPAIDLTLMTSREIAALEFAANGPLAPDERRQVADDVRAAVQRAPAQMAVWNKSYVNLLARMPTMQPGDAEAERAGLRSGPVFPPSAADNIEPISSTERRILEAHDPVVVVDAVSKRLVTERSLVVLRDAAASTAQAGGLPGPDDSFIDQARQAIRAGYSGFPKEAADGLAHIGLYARDEAGYLQTTVPAKRDAFFATQRDALAAVSDPAGKQVWLAKFTAAFVENAHILQSRAHRLAAKQAPVPAPVEDPAALAKLDIDALEFIVAAPLALEERQQIAEVVRTNWQTEAGRMAAIGGRITQDLATDLKLSPEDAEATRESWRGGTEFPSSPLIEPWASVEKRIEDAHDPIVALDAAKRRLVTERSLFVLRNAAAWTAQKIGLPGPDDTFIDRARAMVRARYPLLPDEVARGLAVIAGNSRYEAGYINDTAPEKRDAFFAATRNAFAAVRDPAEQQWWLARFTATFADTAAKVQVPKIEAMQNRMLQAATQNFAKFVMMSQFSNTMLTQQKNLGHIMRHERLSLTPYD